MSHVQSLRSSERSPDTELLHTDSVVVMKKSSVVNISRYLYFDKNVGQFLVQLISSKLHRLSIPGFHHNSINPQKIFFVQNRPIFG